MLWLTSEINVVFGKVVTTVSIISPFDVWFKLVSKGQKMSINIYALVLFIRCSMWQMMHLQKLLSFTSWKMAFGNKEAVTIFLKFNFKFLRNYILKLELKTTVKCSIIFPQQTLNSVTFILITYQTESLIKYKYWRSCGCVAGVCK